MRPAGVGYLQLAGFDIDVGLSSDKMAKDLLGIALLETAELLGSVIRPSDPVMFVLKKSTLAKERSSHRPSPHSACTPPSAW